MVNRLLLALSLLAAAAFVGPVIGVFRPAASDAVERAPGRVGRAIADAGGRPAGRADAAPIVVSAAASLTDALQEIAAGWKKASGDTVTLNFGASNVLARQIVAGAPVDLFISADEAQLGLVEHAELLVPGSRVDLLGNELVIAVPADRPTPVTSPRGLALPAVRRIAVGDPAAVPAGVYARRFLEAQGLWASLQDKIVPTGTVRLALAAVEQGVVDAALVYRTDVPMAPHVRIAYTVAAADGPKIVYPAALVTTGARRAAAGRFLEYLRGPAASAVFRRAGFAPLAARRNAR